MRTPQPIDMTFVRSRILSGHLDPERLAGALGAPINLSVDLQDSTPLPSSWIEALERLGAIRPEEAVRALDLLHAEHLPKAPNNSRKVHTVRIMLTRDQKRTLYTLRARVREEKGRGALPTEQDILHHAIAKLCRKYTIAWPSCPKVSKSNPPRVVELDDPTRMYCARAVLSADQKEVLRRLRDTVRLTDTQSLGHAYMPTESEVLDQALALLATSYRLVWPLRQPCGLSSSGRPK